MSIELSQRCGKACWFCYSESSSAGASQFSAGDLLGLARDAALHGVRAVSFGGGEPLESPILWPLLRGLEGSLFRSLTSNGLLLDDPAVFSELIAARPDKVHVSIHFPTNLVEVDRVIEQVDRLAAAGVRSGINLLVRRSQLEAATLATRRLHSAGIDNRRIVFLPMRGQDTPTPQEIAGVAGGAFQSMTCLAECGASPRFCAVRWDASVAWCSYTQSRRPLQAMTYAAVLSALSNLDVEFCGNAPWPAVVQDQTSSEPAARTPTALSGGRHRGLPLLTSR